MRIRWLSVVGLLILTLCACTKQEVIKMELSPEESNFINLTTQVYTYEELTAIAGYDGNIHQFDSSYPFECIRYTEGLFRVAYRGKENVAIIYFDKSGKKTLGRVYNLSVPLTSFDNIIGYTLDDILTLDPLGDYTFIYTGQNDYLVSEHYTSDGFLVRVTYNKENIVLNVQTERI